MVDKGGITIKQRRLLAGLITVTLLMAILAGFSCTGSQ